MTGPYVNILIMLAALGSALVAGIFYAFSTFVMTALGRLAPEQGISAMQAINVAVLNPWFFGAFFGTALGAVALAIIACLNEGRSAALYLAAGVVLYLAGSILVTMVFNVPLNNKLAAKDPASAEGAALWIDYRSRWTFWNHVRTGASLAAAAGFLLVLRV